MPESTLRLRDGRWFLQDPSGDLPLGRPLLDRLPDGIHALSAKDVRDLLEQWYGPAGPMPDWHCNRHFHRAETGRQGRSRATCAAFALNAAIEGRLARDGRTERLSAECTNGLFMRAMGRDWCDDTLPLWQAVEILHAERTCREADCAYVPKAPLQCGHGPAVLPPRTFGLRNCLTIKQEALQDPDALMRLVHAGIDVVITVMPHFSQVMLGSVHHSHNAPTIIAAGVEPPCHAMVIVGYGHWQGEPFFDCYDSLGLTASDRGYVKVSAGFLRANGLYGYAVTQVVG